jgi:hypothetical protein
MAMRERNDRAGGAVCLHPIGRLGRDDGLGNPMIRGILQQDQKEPCTLRASWEHWITRLISARLNEQGLNAVPNQRVARVGRIDRRFQGLTSRLDVLCRFVTINSWTVTSYGVCRVLITSWAEIP